MAKRNVFDLSHDNKLTCNMGELVPAMCEEVYPGEKWRIRSDALTRFLAMKAPIFHDVDVFLHFWYVPTRLVHDNWEKFITGGKNGQDDTVIPTIKSPAETGYGAGTLWDYLGCPTGVPEFETLAYPFRVYNLIYNEFYMDEDLQDEATLSLGDGLDTTTNTTLLKRCWQRDYFTKARPFEQKGPQVKIPLGTVAPVSISASTDNFQLIRDTNSEPGTVFLGANSNDLVLGGTNSGSQTGTHYYGGLKGSADLSNATSATINELRLRTKLQEWFEINMIAGSRYVEQTLSMFGVKTGDARLQRPEFIGAVRSPVFVSEVLQNSETSDDSPLGNMAGHAFSASSSRPLSYYFPEHGYVMCLLSIMPKTGYFQGSPRKWNRRTRFDFAWPLFSNLGYQAIENKEVFAQGTDDDAGIFGYTGRYDELRSIPNEVHGDFKGTLDYWHMARKFTELPVLNEEFVEADPTKRIFATQGYSQQCLVKVNFNITAIRPFPKRSIPGFN